MFRACVVAVLVAIGATVTAAQQPQSSPRPAAAHLRANRVIVRVTDLQKSIAFYRDLVGLPLQSTYEEFAVLDAGGVVVMLQQITRASSGPSTGLAALTEIVLESPDVLASYRELKSRGVVFRIEPRLATTDGARDLYTADFRDPDGHVLSIAGWLPREK